MKNVILDTNSLLFPAQFNVDVYEEVKRVMHHSFELFVLERSVDELKKIVTEQKGKDKEAAKLALQIMVGRVNYLKTEKGHVDDLIVERVDKDTYVVTQDRELKDRVQEKGGNVITLRNKKYLEIV